MTGVQTCALPIFESLSETYFLTKALVVNDPDYYQEEYGISVKYYNEIETVDAIGDYVSYEDFDASADFVNIKAIYSWRMLSAPLKLAIFDLLTLGLRSETIELSKDSEHFLGCMALHPDTPQEILEMLAALGNELVTATLARR